MVTLTGSGKTFPVTNDMSILDCALKQGITLAYGCKNGACGSCKGKVISGEVTHGQHSANTLTSEEESKGVSLFCCAFAQTDCEIQAREVQGTGDIVVKKVPCRVNTLEKVAPDVMVLKLQLPATERFQYLAGQYIEFLLKDGKRRAYSIATPPHEEGPIELHIRHLAGGTFTDFVFGHNIEKPLKEKDLLRFEGPLGSFFLRDSDKPIIFLASGTGFAPIKAIVEHMQYEKISRPITLYWGGRRQIDLYHHDLCLSWTNSIPNFTYIPVISDATPEDHWAGRTGFVHQAVMADIPNMSNYQVYACGAPIVISSAQKDFVEKCKLPDEEFFADSFTSEADLANSTN
ncbi:MAG: CDP-6-deoxy-delta-3,4-glucoseen reductase [Betaproteobacteria bacterium]